MLYAQIILQVFETPEKSATARTLSDSDLSADDADGFDIRLPDWAKSSATGPPADSVGTSASELLFADLSEKTKLLKIAADEAHQYRLRCLALRHELASVKKRQREELAAHASSAVKEHDPETSNPKKRPSPEVLAEPSEVHTDISDDEVPLPQKAPDELRAKGKANNNRLFEKLHSVLCGYKDEKVFPGSAELPYDVCAQLCREEAATVKSWKPSRRSYYHKNILSALRLVYPHKRDEWFKSPFLLHPDGAAKYWISVLTRRSEIWEAAGKRMESHPAQNNVSISLKARIRQKIEERRKKRTRSIKASLRTVGFTNPFKTPTRKTNSGLSSSGSDNEVVDLSKSPAGPEKAGVENPPAPSPPKLAPPPEYVHLN